MSYPAKILLFGEYSVLKGSQALAVPLEAYSGRWAYTEDKVHNISHQHISDLKNYLTGLQESGQLLFELDTDALQDALSSGLYFDSDIPEGYGAGSSGAVCAAVYDRFGVPPKETSLPGLKRILAQVEGYFHGNSSGLDPLVSYTRQPLLVQPGGEISEAPVRGNSFAQIGLFLLDTGIRRSTAPLVRWFLDACNDPYFEKRCISELIPLSEEAIHYYLYAENNADEAALFSTFHQISYFQLKYFSKLIPDTWIPLWKEGLSSDTFKLKLCGAGGGGFMLGIHKKDSPLLGQVPVHIRVTS